MLVGKLIKPCKIAIYDQEEDGGEVESFSLLKLSFLEAFKLALTAQEKVNEYEITLDKTLVIKYSGNDEVHQLWKEIAVEHQKEDPKAFFDVSATFPTDITGTSCLIRDPKKHEIRIAKRDGNDTVTINRICIDNEIREKFFNDVKLCTPFKTIKKYYMDTRDFETYSYWSKYMNTSFIQQLARAKAKKK